MTALVRDVIFIKRMEQKLGRKLTDLESWGIHLIKIKTNDGCIAKVRVPVYPLKHFYSKGLGL